MAVIIFALDDQREHTQQSVLSKLRAKFSKNVIRVRGSYKGVEEYAFMIEESAFFRFDHEYGPLYLSEQESVLRVSSCNKMYADLIYSDKCGGAREALGSMQQVSEEVARSYDAWTYRPDMGTYYICAHSNPDHAHKIKPREADKPTIGTLKELKLNKGDRVKLHSTRFGFDEYMKKYKDEIGTVVFNGSLAFPSGYFSRNNGNIWEVVQRN